MRAFPQCTDLSADPSRGISAFTPHLSLGQWRTPAEVAAAAQRLAGGWSPLTFPVGGVALLSRAGFEDPFAVRWYVPFGGGAAQRVDAPYIATVGAACNASAGGDPGLAQRWGIGAARRDGSVWHFAYGANISATERRGVHPLESLPAVLPDWRLAFTHRGGMGNLQPLAAGEAGPAGLGAVHGVLHRLTPAQYGKLACMEHEYRPVEVAVTPYEAEQPVPAVAFVTPEAARIADSLPPPQR